MSRSDDQLIDLGWTPDLAEDFVPYLEDHWPARVTRVDRGGADLVDASGLVRATFGGEVLQQSARDRSLHPAVGDWAVLRRWPDGQVTVDGVLPRRTSFVRDTVNRTSQAQVVASNVDVAVIVEPLDPEPAIGRIERLLVLAWGSGAAPFIVLTKPDLVHDPDDLAEEVRKVAPGIDVITVNATSGAGVDELRGQLGPGRTMVLLGPSGAGKSSLVNALAGRDLMKTGAVRERDGQGRHTTKHRELVVIPGTGVIIDTPGLRAVGLAADGDAVASTFPEIEELAELCRFRDCSHDGEPGCAIATSIHDGSLGLARVESWRKLRREAARHSFRADARLRAAEKAGLKRQDRERKQQSRSRPPRQ
jgi:ribosome biogenesis GTPase